MHQQANLRIAGRVRALAAQQTNVALDDITMESHLQNDLRFDSLDHLDYAAAIEDEYQIRIPDEQVPDLRNIGHVVELVVSMLGRRQTPAM